MWRRRRHWRRRVGKYRRWIGVGAELYSLHALEFLTIWCRLHYPDRTRNCNRAYTHGDNHDKVTYGLKMPVSDSYNHLHPNLLTMYLLLHYNAIESLPFCSILPPTHSLPFTSTTTTKPLDKFNLVPFYCYSLHHYNAIVTVSFLWLPPTHPPNGVGRHPLLSACIAFNQLHNSLNFKILLESRLSSN